MKEINVRIKEKRIENGLTLLEVAELLGVKEATVQRYESGNIKNIKHETICKLAEIFNCSPSWLMGFDISSKQENEAVANAIKSGKYTDAPIKQTDIPDDASDESEDSDDFYSNASDELLELVRIYQSLDGKSKIQLLAYACELESKLSKMEED